MTRENESAQVLARHGYDVEQRPKVPGSRNPDYLVEGRVFDNFAPSGSSARNIWSEIRGKVNKEQAHRVVLNLGDSDVDRSELRRQFREWPMPGLIEVLVVHRGGVSRLVPEGEGDQRWR